MANPDQNRQLRNGIFVTAALVIAGVFVVMIGSKNALLSRKVSFVTYFPNANGLKDGDSVSYLGVRVGYCEKFVIGEGTRSVAVYFKVDEQAARQFTTSSRATIAMLGVLGDKFIEIIPGKEGGAKIEPGTEIPYSAGTSIETITGGAQDLVTNLQQLSGRLNNTLDMIEKGQGTLPRLLNDPEFSKVFLGDLQASMHDLRALLGKLEHGEGALPRLMNDKEYAGRLLGNMDSAAQSLNGLAARLEKGPGVLHSLAHDAAMERDLKAIIQELKEFAAALGSQKSLLGRLLNDAQYGDSVSKNLASAVSHLNSILGKIDRGEGTLGAIVNDRSVYEDIKDLSAGLNKSTLGKAAVKHYQKKGNAKRKGIAPGPDTPPPAEPPEVAPAPESAPGS